MKLLGSVHRSDRVIAELSLNEYSTLCSLNEILSTGGTISYLTMGDEMPQDERWTAIIISFVTVLNSLRGIGQTIDDTIKLLELVNKDSKK